MPPLDALLHNARAKIPLGQSAPPEACVRSATTPGKALYANKNDRLGIDFDVERLEFPDAQTLDPRVVRIAPGKCNEWHKHAHETLFVILEGEGDVRIGGARMAVRKGDVAIVPRWAFHQTINTASDRELVVLAITDFGFTSAVLGDYDRETRQRRGAPDADAVDASVESH